MNSNVYIECAGAPATGKTTLASALRTTLIKSGVKVTGNYSLHHNGSKWRRVLRGIFQLLHTGPLIKTWNGANSLPILQRVRLLQVVTTTLADNSSAAIRLYDQGIFNFLLTRIAYDECTVTEGRAILEALLQTGIALPSHVIVVSTPPHISYQRLQTRNEAHPLTRVKEVEYQSFYSRYSEAAEKLIIGYTKMLHVDGTTEVTNIVTTVINSLKLTNHH